VPQQFVVTYLEFKPVDTKARAQMLEELCAKAEHNSGVQGALRSVLTDTKNRNGIQ
jgi:hypothetical protein